MEESHEQSKQTEEQVPKFRGLYRYVKISVKALDRIIVACIAVIVIVVALELLNPGYTITFDTKGGTDVASQTQMYGEPLTAPEPPTREGYRFTGWYKDYNCDEQWDLQNDTIEVDLTLYAGWEKLE